jgi:hypothetical protein
MGRRVDAETPRRLITLHWGDSKTGKTDTALSFPEGIWFGNINFGVDELLLGPRYSGRDVDIEDFKIENPGNHEECQRAVAQFHIWWTRALEEANRVHGTVVVDTTSELWELIRVVKLEEAKRERFSKQSRVSDLEQLKASRLDYQVPNAYMRQLMVRPFHFPNVNVAYLASCRSKYTEAGQELNDKLYNGFGALPAIAQATFMHTKVGKPGAWEFRATVERCRQNTEIEGLTIKDPSYEKIKAFIYGE